jgi:ATP-dependent Zn protease
MVSPQTPTKNNIAEQTQGTSGGSLAAAVAAAFERLSGETQRITATGFEEEMSTIMHSRRSRRT